jgi:threonine/homoserine/homoserine lactone efflux protein
MKAPDAHESIAAGAILIFIGIKSYFKKLDLEHHEGENAPMQDIVSTALLNALNPTLIFSFTVLFTAMGMQKHVGHPREIIVFLIGIASGSFLFWFAVAKAVGYLRRTDREHWVQSANKYTGIALGIIGVILVVISIIRSVF